MYRKVFANKVFDRKVVVITGGCAGIGRALAVRLAQAGARLVIPNATNKNAIRDIGCSIET
jgi:NAD(P)-dependent dehydrogenase (short-subunit alcohol dehydrogenase family)